MLVGAWIALFKDDLKGILAHSTVSHLGLMTMLLGIGTPFAATAAVFHILNHAIFKAALFMSAGIVDHETHTRDIRRLGGLVHVMPISATLALDRERGDGRRAALQRLPLEGDDARSRAPDQLRRVADAARRAGHAGRAALGGLLGALRRSESTLASRRPNHWRWPIRTSHHSALAPVAILAFLAVAIGVFPQQLAAALVRA